MMCNFALSFLGVAGKDVYKNNDENSITEVNEENIDKQNENSKK